MARRRLTEADRSAWEAYRRTTDPLDPKGVRDIVPDPAPVPAPGRGRPPARIADFKIGARARAGGSTADLAPGPAEALRRQTVTMDQKAFHRLKAGKLRPEGKLDLHGMTLDVAHPALIDFVLGARVSGKRLLLVVTGKGKVRDEGGPIPTRTGVLRHQVPQWLRLPPLAPLILQVVQAHQSHGGLGAYYVYLRR